MYVQPTSFFVSSMSLYHKPLHPNGPSVELVCNKINMHGCRWGIGPPRLFSHPLSG
jgi:hypothetical protein